MKNKKLYSYQSVLFGSVFFGLIFVVMLIPTILFPKKCWLFIIPMFLMLLIFFYSIKVGVFNPIYYTDKNLKYRGKEYKWEDIKITAVSVPNSGYIKSYLLLFGIKFFTKKVEIKAEKRKGFYVFLMKKPLNEILKYYKNKILIIDCCGNDGDIDSTKKINQIIKEHNEKIMNKKGSIINVGVS